MIFKLDLLDEILKLPIGVSNSANRDMFKLLNGVYDFNIKSFSTGSEHNGWVIPHDWYVKKALIKKNGDILFDGKRHPMAVAGYSSSFCGKIQKNDLDKHIYYNTKNPKAYAFHCVYNYRPWVSHWGFCVPYDIYKDWNEGIYEIELETEFREGVMQLGEWRISGELTDTIVFNAHTCHPCQANDDMIGVLLILELFQWLSSQKTRYSYLAIIGPEHIGTIFYLKSLDNEMVKHMKLGCYVEMAGTGNPLYLQRSFLGNTIIDRVAHFVLNQQVPNLRVGGFMESVGNDEAVWEAPGYEVPMISISRWPYEEYHTSNDNLNIILEESVTETFESLKEIVRIFENDIILRRKFNGLIALSNPKYDLYIEREDPSFDKQLTDYEIRLGELQDHIFRYFDGKHTVFEIAEKYHLKFDNLRYYCNQFEEKGLIDTEPVHGVESYYDNL